MLSPYHCHMYPDVVPSSCWSFLVSGYVYVYPDGCQVCQCTSLRTVRRELNMATMERPPQSDLVWENEMWDAIYKVCPSLLANPPPHLIDSQHREMGKRKTLVIIAGAHDNNLQPIRAKYVKEVWTDRLGLDTRVITLGHTQQRRPCAFDRVFLTIHREHVLMSQPAVCSLRYRAWKPSRRFWRQRQILPRT